MSYQPRSKLSSTQHKNVAESGNSNRNNSGRTPESHVQSRRKNGREGRSEKAVAIRISYVENGREGRSEKAVVIRISYVETREKERDGLMSRIQARRSRVQYEGQENVGTDGSKISSSSPWTPSSTTILIPQQPSAPRMDRSSSAAVAAAARGRWNSMQRAPDVAEEPIRNRWSVRQSAVHSKVILPEKDEVLRSKLHYSGLDEKYMNPTRTCVPRPPQDNSNEGSKKPTYKPSWSPYTYQVSPVQSSTSTNPFISRPHYSPGDNPTPSPRGYHRTDYPPYPSPFVAFRNGYPLAATPSPRYMDAPERRESSSKRYRRAHSRNESISPPRSETIKPISRHDTIEGIILSSYEDRLNRRRRYLEAKRRVQEAREGLSAYRYGSRDHRRYTAKRPRVPTQCKLWSEKSIRDGREDVQFQYQDPPQTLPEPQDHEAKSRGRNLAQKRKKRSPGEKTQQSLLDSHLDLGASAEKLSQEDDSRSRTEPQLIGRHRLADWKLSNGKSKDWRRKPSAKSMTLRQVVAAMLSNKPLHYSPVDAKCSGMAKFGRDIPAAAQKSSRGKMSVAERFESPVFPFWAERKGFRKVGMKRFYMRDVLNEEEFEVEAHRKSRMRPEIPPKPDWYIDAFALIIESWRRYQFSQEFPSGKISHDVNPLHCLQIHYVGRVIPSPDGSIQLLGHIESSAHAEIYRICILGTGHETFAKIYSLRGIHPNQRKRRLGNLKTLQKLNKLLRAIEWEGKKVCVFSNRYKTEYTSLSDVDSPRKAAGIGAIGRRNTKEYNAAFPPLPPSTPIPAPAKVPDEATEPLTPEQQLQMKTLEVIRSEIEGTSSKRWKFVSKEPLPLAQRLIIQLMDLNGLSVAERNSEWKVRDCGVLLKNGGYRKWIEDGKDKDLEVKIKKKRGRKKKSKKELVV